MGSKPPAFPDLGKLARELFKKGYHPGLWQLNCNTKTQSGLQFNTTGYTTQDAGKVIGSLGTTYTIADYGITLTERWSTDNWLFGEIKQSNKLAEGLTLALEGKYQPPTGEKDGKFKLGYSQEFFTFNADMNLDLNGPLINASIVLGYENFLGGYATAFDSGAGSLQFNKFALGFATPELVLHAECKDGQDFYASVFHKCNENIDAAVEVGYGAGGEDGDGEKSFGVGCVYHLDANAEALIRAKVNNNGELGLGYQQKLRDGIFFSISTVIDGKNLNEGSHKFGIGFTLDA